jgi:hypothetical protein
VGLCYFFCLAMAGSTMGVFFLGITLTNLFVVIYVIVIRACAVSDGDKDDDDDGSGRGASSSSLEP